MLWGSQVRGWPNLRNIEIKCPTNKNNFTVCNTENCIFFKNLYFLVTNVSSVSKLILWYLNNIMSSIDLATWITIGIYLLNREKQLTEYKSF